MPSPTSSPQPLPISHITNTLDYDILRRRLMGAITRVPARSLVLLVSPLDGTILSDLVSRISSSSKIVPICFNPVHIQEYEKTFATYGKYFHIPQDTPLVYGKDSASLLKKLIHTHYFQHCTIIYYSRESYLYQQESTRLLAQCQEEISQMWVNHATQSFFGLRWMKNMCHNLSTPHYKYALPKFDSPSHKIALVIGAGPSLTNTHVHFIHSHRASFVIFAVDTVMPVLHKNNIVPDFCILLESQFYNMQDLIPPPPTSTIAIGDLTCYPSSLRVFTHTICISTQFSPLSFFDTHSHQLPPPIPPLGSVGILAFYIAILSQPSHIMLVGLDFSYYKGMSHVPHSPPHTRWMREHTRTAPWTSLHAHHKNKSLQYAKSIAPSPLVEDFTLKNFRHKVEQYLLPLAHSYRIDCIDLNRYSIIQGVRTLSPTEAEQICKKTQGNPSLQWAHPSHHTHYDTFGDIPSSHEGKAILHSLQALCTHFSKRIKTLSHTSSLPSQEDWEQGLDNFAFMLQEDPYLVHHDLHFWEEKNIYSKIYMNIAQIADEIARIS